MNERTKKGYIDLSRLNHLPEEHELETAKYFADRGKNIIFIATSLIPNTHTPDILMDNIEWEIKCPQGKSKRTIENIIRAAVIQSDHIIIDLRRIKLQEEKCLNQIKKEFEKRKYIKKILIISKNNELILLNK